MCDLAPRRWIDEQHPTGARVPIRSMWPLAQQWSRDRLAPDRRPASIERLQGVLDAAGLTEPFRELTP